MTNERAIELLNRISDSQFDGIHGDERREALSMAVRALESNLVKESGDLVQDLVKDCISRKMAIDEVKRLHDVAWANWKETRISANTMIDALKDLPSAQPKTHDKRTETHACNLIDRQAAMIVIENSGLDDDSKDTVVRVLEQLPSAQPERRTGKWIVQDIYKKDMYRVSCSCCGESSMVDQRSIAKAVDIKVYNFCPNCGARMEGESDG